MTAPTSRAVLASNRLFSSLPGQFLDELSRIARRRDAAAGTLLFAQDEPGDAFYGVISGRIRISSASLEGREMHIVDVGPGDTFGEVALLDGGPRTASATVVDSASLFTISRAAFVALLEEEPKLTVGLLERLCERLRWTSELVEDLSFLDADAQIAKRIWLLAEHFAEDTAAGRELRLPQGDLAAFLGLSRQAVNTHLQRWRAEGWVDLSRGKIVLVEPAKLKAVFEQTR